MTDERLRRLTQGEELTLGVGTGAWTARCRFAWCRVVRVKDRCFTGCELDVLGNDITVRAIDLHSTVVGDDFDVATDETMRDRVTHRRDPHG